MHLSCGMHFIFLANFIEASRFARDKSLDLTFQAVQSAGSWSNSALLIVSRHDVISELTKDFETITMGEVYGFIRIPTLHAG